MSEEKWVDPTEGLAEWGGMDEDSETCPDCFGEGFEVVCFDDICVGQGYCMHGDGHASCRTCKGSGEI